MGRIIENNQETHVLMELHIVSFLYDKVSAVLFFRKAPKVSLGLIISHVATKWVEIARKHVCLCRIIKSANGPP